MIDNLVRLIIENKSDSKPLIVGITGIDASGKTEIAKRLEKKLELQGIHVQTIHIDDFHNTKKIRYSTNNQIINYYNHSFDYNTLINEILMPIKKKRELDKSIMLVDHITDEITNQKKYCIKNDTIVLLEGVFLFRKETRPFVDLMVHLDIDFEECLERAKYRDVPIYGEEILLKYNNKYLPTQEMYLELHSPEEYADIIIDNNDFHNPFLVLNKVY